jgi:hypothetical protein
MGNIVNSLVNEVYVYYTKVKNKLIGSAENQHMDSLLSNEEKKENTDSVIIVKKENKDKSSNSIIRNEYQLLKSGEEYECLRGKQDNQLIEEMSKEIKNVNIVFENNDEGESENKKEINEENLDDLKMQILSEHEDNI